MRFLRIAFVAAPLAAACGLSVTGELVVAGPDGGPAGGGGGPIDGAAPGDDAGAFAVDAAGACSQDACGLAVPPGFALVAFGAASKACPAGFAPTDVFESPSVTAGACTCDSSSACSIVAPSCNSGSVTSTFDDNAAPTCDQSGAVNPLNNGMCRMFGATFGNHAGLPAPAPSGGSCTAAATIDSAKTTSTASRVCASSSCADVCAQNGGADFAVCLLADGDQPCPTEAPTKHLVGTKIDVTCGACSSCALAATCGGTMTFYSDSNCMNAVKAINAGQCANTNGVSFSSYKWAGMVVSPKCNASGAPAGTAALGGLSTVCCR